MNVIQDDLRKKAVQFLNAGGKLKYSFTTFSGQYMDLTHYVVNHILASYKLNYLDNVIITFLREVVENGVKANLKRAYFDARKADIQDPEQYASVIREFRAEGVANLEDFIPVMQEMNLKVQVFMETGPEGLRVIVQNNSGMTADELTRARTRIQAAAEVTSIAEVLERFEDDTEGAGLGILLNMLLLKKTGIGTQNFQIASNEQNTRVMLRVPRTLTSPPEVLDLYNRIAEQIQRIPTFPDTVQRILTLCDNATADMRQITLEIEKDPSVAASILRLANSGGFVTSGRVDSIARAVGILGMNNVRSLVVAHSSRQILEKNYKVFEDFWQHASQTALYCRLIAEETGHRKVADTVYLGGLLHDLGKILLYSLEPEEVKKINGLNLDRTEASTAVLEEITLGLSHAEVGARLARKWNFGEALTEMIHNHHSPFAAADAHRVAVSIVHIADGFVRTERERASYIYFDVVAQGTLNIHSSRDLADLHAKVKERAQAMPAL